MKEGKSMSLGNGCFWKNHCQYYSKQANSFHKKRYCNDDHGCSQCSHRPMNYGNEEIRRNEEYAQSGHSTIKLGQIILIICIILAIAGMLLK